MNAEEWITRAQRASDLAVERVGRHGATDLPTALAASNLPVALAAIHAVLALCDEEEQRIRASTPPLTAGRLTAEGEAATVTVRSLRQAIEAALAG